MSKILILGGTKQAVHFGEYLGKALDISVVYSLAGRTENPILPQDCILHQQGFGGIEGLENYINTQKIIYCLDITHPFAENISRHAEQACQRADIVYHKINRTAWQAMKNDQWYEFSTPVDLIKYLDLHFKRALFTLGTRNLRPFLDLKHTQGIFRMIHASDEAIALQDTKRHQLLTLRPPYSIDLERKILHEYAVDCLVTRASGGKRSAKLDACVERNIPVLFLNDKNILTDSQPASVEKIYEEIQQHRRSLPCK